MASYLRSWLRKPPAAVAVVADGKKIKIGNSPKKWADAEESIMALGATKIEALDAAGDVLRVTEIDHTGSMASGGGEGEGEGEEKVKGLAGLSDLAQLATVVGQISDQAARRHEAAYKLAFGELSAMVGVVVGRLNSMEQSWVASLQAIADLKVQLADAIGEARNAEQGEATNPLVAGLIAQMAAGEGAVEKPKNGAKT